ncbi:HTTM domain-containing protein [Aureispira anguillae]|uniref:HTTM domain-containing protein n=1 Tax=Aureispira anguillae TaxID=2864201 RepID=A0A915YIM6_9BACT|nr:HTTM domain-containing protein [Aureispira anguillae]BDS13699.1 HTTM domain-containing protein [Aureispira anguillae]
MNTIINLLSKKISIAPLLVFRILFGLMVAYGALWSIGKGDIQMRYLKPTFFFKYYGMEWLEFVGDTGIYFLYAVWILSALGIILGAFYRLSIGSFFLVFTYLQALDATNYINHYYAISILALFLTLLPANAALSIDAWRKPQIKQHEIPYWYIGVFQVQVALIYTFAAIAKMNSDWLLAAMPLKIWLLQSQDFPLIGSLFKYHAVHLGMSWIGFLFDLTIAWWLWNSKTRKWAYIVVVIFHTMTGLLFNIGLFPILMIFSTIVFFSPNSQLSVLQRLGVKLSTQKSPQADHKLLICFFSLHFFVQVILPFRHHLLYNSNPLWSEEGYRFSWWVMLLEKEGMATFYVEDPNSERHWVVSNLEFLTPFQEKRMAIRPDHILQYAHHLAAVYARRYEIKDPIVRAEVFVAMNGRVSQQLIDPTVNLAAEKRSLWQKDWILPLQDAQ